MNERPNRNLLVWWVLWASFLCGIIQFYLFLGTKQPPPTTKPSIATAFLGLIPFFVSGIIRWVVLPRMRSANAAFPLFIVGIAFAEAVCFFGLFLFPAYKLEFSVISFIGIAQFAPFFARKYFA